MGGGGVQRIVKFLKYFDYSRYEVTVLTVKESFFYTTDNSLIEEVPSCVRIVRSGSLDPFRLIYLIRDFFFKIKTSKASNDKYTESSDRIRRVAMSVFIPDSRLLWLPFAILKLWHLHRIKPIDLLISSMPPFTSGLIAALFKQWMKVPVVLDFRDAWTNNAYLPEMGAIYSRLNHKMELHCIRRANGVVFINPALASYYKHKYAVDLPQYLTIIRNGYDPDDFKGIDLKKKTAAKKKLAIGMMGTVHSQGNRPLTLLKALKKLCDDNPEIRSKVRFVLLGKWAADFLKIAELESIGDIIEFIPYLPHKEALKTASGFDLLSLSIEEDFPGSSIVTPGRIYEYLRLKKPVLAICPLNSDLAKLVKTHNAGESVSYNDIEGIENILVKWIENPAVLSQKYSFGGLNQLSRKNQAKQLVNFLDKLQESSLQTLR
jgi:glycosyltransferase involved in cell wall biosynthesis